MLVQSVPMARFIYSFHAAARDHLGFFPVRVSVSKSENILLLFLPKEPRRVETLFLSGVLSDFGPLIRFDSLIG